MGAPHNALEDLLDEHDLARITKRSLASIRHDRLLKKNCPFVKIGASVRYLRSDVEEWLRSLPRRGGHQKLSDFTEVA
jgi:predicted DNA-binding transcriptional regulator AlpA